MKIVFKHTSKISNALIIILFLKICFIACEGAMLETEFENTLIKLLKNLQNKRLEKLKDKNPNSPIDVKIEKVFDLNYYIKDLDNIKNKNENSKKEYYNYLEKKSNLIAQKNSLIQKSIIKLKDKYNNIIENSNLVNKNLNDRKTEEIKANAAFNNKQMEYDNINGKFLYKVQNLKNNFDKNSNKHFNFYHRNLSNLKNSMDLRKITKDEMLKTKLKENKIDLQYKEYKKLDAEQQADFKMFNLISKSLVEEAKNYNLNSLNSNVKIENLNKAAVDESNFRKLEFEKEQQNEFGKEYNKKLKDLLSENENIQNEIKELDKKKNRISLKLKKKEIEIALKTSSEKNEVKILQNQIKTMQDKILKNIKKQKTVILILYFLFSSNF